MVGELDAGARTAHHRDGMTVDHVEGVLAAVGQVVDRLAVRPLRLAHLLCGRLAALRPGAVEDPPWARPRPDVGQHAVAEPRQLERLFAGQARREGVTQDVGVRVFTVDVQAGERHSREAGVEYDPEMPGLAARVPLRDGVGQVVRRQWAVGQAEVPRWGGRGRNSRN